MKVLSFALFLFLLAAISWMDYRITGLVHLALLLPAGLITIAFSFVREKKSSLVVFSALILILSFAKRTPEHQIIAKQPGNSVTAALSTR